ncbi:VIT1/CCC1 transporter family protein [uncultured Alistipes sp.]|jgi:VIT1/CCC1 family predicted Fe2+/Mn2+ transporter|uniref:VIT1/CCC1 transporter family protein n=1 Tax=uncultured Alistipes sp. TaxID=538949 RepID=UPI0025984B2C|nr:VIT1/CCC1 transporter family protein [uncultured Alistipes sp.]
MDATAKNLLNLQREEATLCEVYRRLAELEKDPVRRQTLVRIMHDERRHCAILKRRTGREMAPDPKRVFWYVWIMRVLGPAFVVRQMELCEKGTEASYSLYAEREEFIRIASEEKRHGEDLTNLAGGMRLSYMSSVVLGLNDALVEFTGALAGFTLALNEPRLVALTGSITGIAAALSMAASEYLSTKSDAAREKHPLRAALCTGTAYLVTVAILIIPYLLFSNAVTALSVMLLAALTVIALFNYYYAVVRSESFRQRFFEMALLSFGIAGISFLIGYGLKYFTGIEM